MFIDFPLTRIMELSRLPSALYNITLDADGEYGAELITFFESKAIKYVHFYISVHTTNGNYQIALMSIDDATGQPSRPNAVLGGGSPASVTANIAATGWKRWQLDNNYTPAAGEQLFCRFMRNDAVSGNTRLGCMNPAYPDDQINYLLSYLGASLTVISGGIASFAFESTDGTFLKCTSCPMNSTTDAFNNTDTPDEIGNLISLPYKHRIIGVQHLIDIDAALDLVLYGVGTSTISLVSNRRSSLNRVAGRSFFSTPIEQNANTSYRLVYKPTSGTDISVFESIFPTGYEATCKALISQGASVSKTSRTDAGAWTDDTTKIVNIQPIIDQIDFPPYKSEVSLLG